MQTQGSQASAAKWNAQIVVAEIQARQRKGLPYARWSDVARDDYALAIAANRCIGHWPKVFESVGENYRH